jgi:SAM-dependent methyltransferase
MNAPSDLLQRWAPAASIPQVLVLGAGDGAEALWLAREGFQVEAIEKDPARSSALAQASAGLAVTVRRADIQALDVRPGTYGLIVALAVLHFVSPQALPHVAGQIAGGLAPGGLLLVQVLSDQDPSAQARRSQGDPELLPNTFLLEDGESVVHYFARGELAAAFSRLHHLDTERYRFAAPGRPEGFGAGEILVAQRPASGEV